jgi:hypothetical protein
MSYKKIRIAFFEFAPVMSVLWIMDLKLEGVCRI